MIVKIHADWCGTCTKLNATMAEHVTRLGQGRMVFAETSRERLYNTCTQADADAAVARLRPMRSDVPASPVPETWRHVGATYVVCEQDRAILPHLQRRMAKHARHVVEIDCDHSPFLSAPEALTDALVSLPAGG